MPKRKTYKVKTEFTCGACKEIKPVAESYRRKYHTYCITCERKINRESNWRNRKIKDIDKANELRDKSIVCEICEEHKPLHLDHNHTTGDIRGMLCFTCNAALGLLKDRKDLCLSAASYLEKGS